MFFFMIFPLSIYEVLIDIHEYANKVIHDYANKVISIGPLDEKTCQIVSLMI